MNRSISPNFTALDNTTPELSAKKQVLGHRDLAAEILSFLPINEVVQHLNAPGTLGEPTIWQEATNTVLRTQHLPNIRLTGEEFGEDHKKRVTPKKESDAHTSANCK